MTCKDCIHERACFTYSGGMVRTSAMGDKAETKCGLFKNKANYAEVEHGEWIKHKPDPEIMKQFHTLGIAKGMSEKSIFWTCSCCKGWGTPAHKYCSHCGAKMDLKEGVKNE